MVCEILAVEWVGLATEKQVFIHFFGTYRYLEGMYLAHSLRLIRDLNAAQ